MGTDSSRKAALGEQSSGQGQTDWSKRSRETPGPGDCAPNAASHRRLRVELRGCARELYLHAWFACLRPGSHSQLCRKANRSMEILFSQTEPAILRVYVSTKLDLLFVCLSVYLSALFFFSF